MQESLSEFEYQLSRVNAENASTGGGFSAHFIKLMGGKCQLMISDVNHDDTRYESGKFQASVLDESTEHLGYYARDFPCTEEGLLSCIQCTQEGFNADWSSTWADDNQFSRCTSFNDDL